MLELELKLFKNNEISYKDFFNTMIKYCIKNNMSFCIQNIIYPLDKIIINEKAIYIKDSYLTQKLVLSFPINQESLLDREYFLKLNHIKLYSNEYNLI